MLKLSLRTFILVLFLPALLVGCNLPQATPQDSNAVFTAAAETVQVQLTLDNLGAPPATTPAPAQPVATTPVPPATATLPPTATASATPLCDLAQFVTDVTVPDGTQFLPDQTFTKTWRLRNLGTCTWSTSYQLIFDSGELMGGPATQPLAGSVAPGQQVDVSVALKAPSAPGTYRGYWRLRNAAGVLVPVASGYQGTSFFIEIKVVAPTATPTVTPTPSQTATPTATPTSTP
ncbi:MAG: hypothetical protein CVU44_01395 [Chloroflexi bacterium HGW-Chloroflexi-6]|nr:MAG: hypothetical protein CVU44_01395 [Chloroflexi bacterium HGW-Chloroflexi-6]